MNRITCEICGTAFQDTAPCCPICGWSPKGTAPRQDMEEVDLGGFDMEEERGSRKPPVMRAASGPQASRRIFDFDEANGSRTTSANTDDDDTYYGGDNGMEEQRRTNTGLIVVLVIFIVLVLLATGVLVVKFLLPKKDDSKKDVVPPTVIAETVESLPAEEETTEAPTVPCTSLFAPAVETLTASGEMWRLNVKASPEDTTDVITYQSENEAVVTVSADGTLIAVGNGTTNIVVKCGSQEVKCPVTVAIATEPEEEEEPYDEGEDEYEETRDRTGVELKLKQTDITFSRMGVYRDLELDCNLTREEVTWMTSNSAIANVNNGRVTAMGNGVAKITAKYGDQTATCIVRCRFY